MASAMIIDGRAIAAQRAASLKLKVQKFKSLKGRAPKLAIVLVGSDPASKIYVNLKVKKARELGIETEVVDDIEKVSPDATGIILQMPCANDQEIIEKIPRQKDVDGLKDGSPFLPATVKAILTILDKVLGSSPPAAEAGGDQVLDKTMTIVGQGKLVGKPLGEYLEKKSYKVIKCDVNTMDLKTQTLRGDVLVCATGVAGLITADMVKPDAIVIDCGSPKAEVDSAVAEIAGAITPVPGGVGPLTIVSLLENVVDAAK